MSKETKESKKIQVNIDTVLEKLRKGQGKVKPIDMSKLYADREKKIKADKKRYDREVFNEKERLEKMRCPCCENTAKEKQTIAHRKWSAYYWRSQFS